jgi:putative flippase GtrA
MKPIILLLTIAMIIQFGNVIFCLLSYQRIHYPGVGLMAANVIGVISLIGAGLLLPSELFIR